MAKNHRTALVVDASNGFEGEFAERVGRLLQSVNGPNVKVDIYTFDGSKLVEGPPSAAKAAASGSIDDLIAPLGYAQVLISKPGK